jgi:XTP/dITP diphosphohydrolase
MKIIFATHNPGKIKEMREILKGLDVEIVSADDAGVTEEIVEDGKTFEENALKMAKFVAEKTGEWVMADDSGICIDALGGEPGVCSARYAGDGVRGEDLVKFILGKIAHVPEENRTATFTTVVALVAPTGDHWFFEGKIFGRLADLPRGAGRDHLPYDTIFLPEGESRTFAEMTDVEKNKVSHRGQAFRKLKNFLERDIKKIEKFNQYFRRPWGLILIVAYKGIWGTVEIILGAGALILSHFLRQASASQFILNFFSDELAQDPQDIFVNWLMAHIAWLNFSLYVGVGLIIFGLAKLVLAVGVWYRSWLMRDIGVVFFSGVAVYGVFELAVAFSFFKTAALFLDILILFYFWHMLPKHLGPRKRKVTE